MAVNGGPTNPTAPGGGGQPSVSALVTINSDVQPVWETEALPDWVVNWLIPMLSAGQKWPEASESGLSKLAHAYGDLGTTAVGSTQDAGTAARTVATGWNSPSTAEFVSRAQVLYGNEGGLAGVSANAHAYGQQANNFAVETQYSKLSINVAFWVTVVAIAIALVAAFFSAGSTTAIIGPYAAAARAAISRILVRLATVGGRSLTASRLARVTTLSGATGRGVIARLLATSLGRELVEEIGEEFFIDAVAQYQQIRMGTRQEWDWKKSQAAVIGAGAGAVIGTRLSGPVSRVTGSVPGFAGRALTTGATNMIASPVGSFFANGAVYGQWQNPFTAESMMGGFLGGAGRAGSISPFNPDVYSALANPVSTLASAYDSAARTDAARMGGDPPAGPTTGGNPSNNGPSSDNQPAGQAPVRGGDPGSARTSTAPGQGGTTRSTTSTATLPDTDTTTNRRASAPSNPDDRPEQPDRPARPDQDTDQPSPDTSEPSARTTRTTDQPSQDTDTAQSSPDTRTTDQPSQDTDTPSPTDSTGQPSQDTSTAEQPSQNARTTDQPSQDTGTPSPTTDSDGQPSQDTGTDGRTVQDPSDGATTTAQAPDGGTTQTGAAAPTSPATGTAPATGPEQGTTSNGAGVYQSKPGTVTSRPVKDTRYVPSGRQGPDMTLDDVRAATQELATQYFRDGTVTGFTWSQDGSTLAVHTTTDGTQYFRPVIGRLSSDGLMAETVVRKQSSKSNPHEVRFNPNVTNDQLSRVWLHEITDTLQKLRSDGRKGFLRRRKAEARRDHCVTARLNEMALLSDKWHNAPTAQEQRLLAIDIEGVAQELRKHGQTPPARPWAPTQATRKRHAPPLPQGRLSDDDVRELITTLAKAKQELQLQITAKETSAAEAREAALKATADARKALRQHDSGRFERARQARKESRNHRATQRRHLRVAKAYERALSRAEQAEQTYARLLAARQQPLRPNQHGVPSVSRRTRRLEGAVLTRHQRYLDALARALPQPASLSTAMPAGTLAHLNALTDTVNDMLARNGARHRFTPDELERAVRADFHRIVSADGLVLRVGRGGTAAELRIKLTLADLVEVLDPGVKASEMMVGLFFQAARTVSATQTASVGGSAGFNTKSLAKALPEGDLASALQLLGIALGSSGGHSQSSTGGAGMYAQWGSVADNRSESLLFDAEAKWTVEIRTARERGWREATEVTSGAPGDPAAQRLWVSHSYTDQPPRRLTRIDESLRDPKAPNLVVSDMPGLEDMFDKIAEELGGDYAKIGEDTRASLHGFVTAELPHRLRDAVNGGIERVFTVDGRPHARVRAESKIILVESEVLGGSTAEEWEEEVLVDFVATSGGATAGRSIGGEVSASIGHEGLEDLDGPGDYSPNLGPKAKGSVGGSRSSSSTANRQAIHPSVHRKISPKQGYRLMVETTFTVEKYGEDPVTLDPMRGKVTASMRESAAYRYGLPVDQAALVLRNGRPVTDANGNPVLRGDPNQDPPPGRKPELPRFIGHGPGKMRGAGPALVQEIDGLDRFRQKVMDQLAEEGLIPKIVDGKPKYASGKLARDAQILNLQEVTKQLSDSRIRGAYDSLAQDGIVFDLVKQGVNKAPEHFSLKISLEQDFDRGTTYIGHTESETVVNLEISSDTVARALSLVRNWGVGASFGLSDGPPERQNGMLNEFGAGYDFARTLAHGLSVGGTNNEVLLYESKGPLGIFQQAGDLKAELLHGGETTTLTSDRTSAKLLFSADLMPPDTETPPATLGNVSPEARAKMRLLHLDVPDVWRAAREVLPRGTREDSPAFHKIFSLLNVRHLVSHAKFLNGPIVSDLIVRGQGMPSRSSLSVSGEMGQATVVGMVDQVYGDILFGLGSAGVSWGGTSGHTTGSSSKVGDVDDGGKSSDSGSTAPGRSSGTSESTAFTNIWGTEELLIEFGRQYVIQAPVDLTLTGSETAAPGLPGADVTLRTNAAPAQGTGLFTISEYDALVLYMEGKLDLPPRLVSDAIERLRNGSLPLDADVAVPLVQKYLLDVARARSAGEDVGYADRHTPTALLDTINELTGLGENPNSPNADKEQQLQNVLSEAIDLIERSRDVVLAPSFDMATGTSLVESITLTDEQGTVISSREAVEAAILAQEPEAGDRIQNEQDLDTDFSENSIRIHLDDAWSRRGFERSYALRADDPSKPPEELTVKYRLIPMDPADSRRAKALTHSKLSGIIKQLYAYIDRTFSRSRTVSYAAGLNYNGSDDGQGDGAGLATDRGHTYTHSVNTQNTRLNRIGLFFGNNRVRQDGMIAVVQVSRHRVGDEPDFGPAVVLDASLVRRVPTGMIMSADRDPGPISTAPDPRQAELRAGMVPAAIWEDPAKPDLFEVITKQLSKMVGAKTVRAQRSYLVNRLARSALLPAFERMSGQVGDVIEIPGSHARNKAAQVTVHARTSDLTIVAGPFDGEKGQVNRQAESHNVSMSRSRVMPVGANVNGSNEDSGLNGGMRGGEQVSETVSDHHGARRERSSFEKGALYIVRFRVDFDLTFERAKRAPGQEQDTTGKPVHMPSAANGLVDVVLTGEELEELIHRMESNVRLAPAFDPDTKPQRFVPDDSRRGLIQVLQDARLAARDRGVPVRVRIREQGTMHDHVAAPDGSVHSMTPDKAEFAAAFATLPPALLDAADQAGLHLHQVFLTSRLRAPFVQQVRAALNERGFFMAEASKPIWPADVRKPQSPVGGSVAQGWAGGASPSPAIEGTVFDRAARPDGTPDLTLEEARGQDLTVHDLGGAAAYLSWTAGDRLTVQFPAAPDQHVRVVIEDPGAGLNGSTEVRAGTPEDPHVMRLWQRTHPDVVSSIMVHELSHVAQAVTAAAAGTPQGVVRPSSPDREGDDLCLLPRLDEHAHLARRWHAATDPAVRGRLADAIDAIADDLERRGHTPPSPPWGTGPRDAAPEQNRIARLLSGGPAADPALAAAHRLSLPETAAVAAVQRAAAAMDARVHVRAPGRLDIVLPGRPPIPVEIHPPGSAVPEQRRAPEQGALTFQVDARLTIGANERAAAAATAQAIARARGQAAADQAALAELYEAVRQVRAATTAQRPGRLGVLFDLVNAHPDVLRLVPEPVAAELATLAAGDRPRDWPAHLQRLRTLANATGWLPPDQACQCPDGEPCTCGRGGGTRPDAPGDTVIAPEQVTAGTVRA
ncbi:hypothetical protein AB0K05_22035 [Nonomuraea sp. NPDC049486]|uniref:WXG100-like domain-containing protein n=1 Tax=Nonomuraea sp. NPDC049486 TaxID=3155773 RepID=UPI00342CB51E